MQDQSTTPRPRLPRIDGATTAERFWPKVDQTGECWIWRGARSRKGYGEFWLNGSTASAHRVAYQLVKGLIPAGIMVLHSCDNPPCVNPSHLSVGTNSDNQRESSERGRHHAQQGPPNSSKLTIEEVGTIRIAIEDGATLTSLAAQYGVCKATIGHIKSGRNWSRF